MAATRSYAEQYVELRGKAHAGLPDTVRAILDARLDALPAAEKALLQDAAVVGHVFWPSAAGHSADETRWRTLEGRQLVRREPRSTIAGQPEYRFAHALLRDAAYERMAGPRPLFDRWRGAIHGRAAVANRRPNPWPRAKSRHPPATPV